MALWGEEQLCYQEAVLVLVPVLGSVPQPSASAGAASSRLPGEGTSAEHHGHHQGLDVTETTA